VSAPAVNDQVAAAARQVFHETAAVLRKARADRRFDREAASVPMATDVTNAWLEGNRALALHLEQQNGFERIAELAAAESGAVEKAYGEVAAVFYIRAGHLVVEKPVEKSLGDAAQELIRALLEGFDWFGELPAKAKTIVSTHLPQTFDDAGSFTLGQLGFADVSFELRDPVLRQALLDRAEAVVFSGRGYIERVMGTITRRFFDRGEVPLNTEFLEEIAEQMDDAALHEARRLALTETGIASQRAQRETMRRNGVPRKSWQTFEDEQVRDSHEVLHGRTIGIDEKFDVNGSPGDGPLDETLPAEEIIHCRCWLTAAFDDDFEIQPELAWRGEER